MEQVSPNLELPLCPPPHSHAPAPHLPLDLPQGFLDWLKTRHRLAPRQCDLIRCRAAQMIHKEIAAALGLRISSVRRLQANTMLKLRLHGGKEGLLRWLAGEYAAWEASREAGDGPEA